MAKTPRVKKQHVGIRRKTTWLCWILLLSSFSFAVYKNFTAVNTHTIHEHTEVHTQLADTTPIATFVTNFANVYYNWKPDHTTLDQRQKELKPYFTDGLVALTADALRSDVPTSAQVNKVQIWQIKQSKTHIYRVVFRVEQTIKNSATKKTLKHVNRAYAVQVYQSSEGNLVLISSPTLAAAPSKAHYRETLDQPDSTLDSDTTNSATKFLTTFFKLYPTGSLNELKYYVKGPVQAIHQDYRFAELVNPAYHRVGKKLKADITVKYLDSATDMTQFAQYELILSKDGKNWTIDSGLT